MTKVYDSEHPEGRDATPVEEEVEVVKEQRHQQELSGNALAALASKRWEVTNGGCMLPAPLNFWVKTDAEARSNIQGILVAFERGIISGGLVPFTINSVTHMINQDQAGAIFDAVATHVALTYAHEAQLIPQVTNNPDTDISKGWPANS